MDVERKYQKCNVISYINSFNLLKICCMHCYDKKYLPYNWLELDAFPGLLFLNYCLIVNNYQN